MKAPVIIFMLGAVCALPAFSSQYPLITSVSPFKIGGDGSSYTITQGVADIGPGGNISVPSGMVVSHIFHYMLPSNGSDVVG